MKALPILLSLIISISSSGQVEERIIDLIKFRKEHWENIGWANVMLSSKVYGWSQRDVVYRFSTFSGDTSRISKGLRKGASILNQNLAVDEIESLQVYIDSLGSELWSGDLLRQVNVKKFRKRESTSSLLISEPIFIRNLIILKEKIYTDGSSYGGTVIFQIEDNNAFRELGYIDITVMTSN